MDYSYTQDRELSWLKFNERVLNEVKNKDMPLLERLKFLEIYTNNLDEFYMVRVGTIFDMNIFKPDKRDSRSNMTPAEQLAAINHEVRKLEKTKVLYYKDIMSDLEEIKIHHMNIEILGNKDKEYLKSYFELRVFPFLTPMVIGKQHPFPHIPNKELHVLVSLSRKDKGFFGIIPIPSNLERVIYLNNKKTRYILLEDLISYYCSDIFTNYHMKSKAVIAVTRSADIDPDDDMFEKHDDYIEHMKKVLKMRGRLHPLRIEAYGELPDDLADFITKKLDMDKKNIFSDSVPLNLKYFYEIIDNIPEEIREKHTYGKYVPAKANMFYPGTSVVKQIQQQDKMLFFPYESIDPFLQLLKECSEDKETVSIKITIYRLAKNAKIVDYLCKAAENGKEVLVLMELRARFDEANNINYSQKLEDAGVTVIYGMENYKVHSKICLITRKTHKGVSYITQIGTGNYNETTSKIYTDFSLMTASREIGEDAVMFFQNITMFNLNGIYNHLLVSPTSLKSTILDKIKNESRKAENGQSCGIFMKMNSLTDRDVINALKDASVAGVPVFLLIRGICCIRPGVEGKTKNIHIESIVGRFLEHTRIYLFGDISDVSQQWDIDLYISSADMMTRNTERRIEVAVPVYDSEIRDRILKIIAVLKKDNVNAKVLLSNDEYTEKSHDIQRFDSQEFLLSYYKSHEPSHNLRQNNGLLDKLKSILNKRHP